MSESGKFNPNENTRGVKAKIEVNPNVVDLLTCDQDDVAKLVKQLCKEHDLKDSSFAKVTEKDGNILIVTSRGTLIAQPDLTQATLYVGNPKGFAPGRNATGHYLPPTH